LHQPQRNTYKGGFPNESLFNEVKEGLESYTRAWRYTKAWGVIDETIL